MIKIFGFCLLGLANILSAFSLWDFLFGGEKSGLFTFLLCFPIGILAALSFFLLFGQPLPPIFSFCYALPVFAIYSSLSLILRG